MKYAVFGMVSLFFSWFVPGCGGQSDRADDGERTPSISTMAQGLSSDPRTRMVQEASYAMWGNHDAYNSTNWPEGTRFATHAYTNQDRGAWDKLMKAPIYGAGRFVSCVRNFFPCYLTYGASEMPYYTCQGSCPARYYRGGQCKAFANLVAYRSSVYQNWGYAFKDFPSDSVINGQPLATYDNVMPGDILRRTDSSSPHAVIVVRKLGGGQVIVLDSNWIPPSGFWDGNGHEIVGSHQMGFSDPVPVRNLGTYRAMKCVYNGSC